MKRKKHSFFVVYKWESDKSSGTGNMSFFGTGIRSVKDLNNAKLTIEQHLIDAGKASDDVNAVILNWGRYDKR